MGGVKAEQLQTGDKVADKAAEFDVVTDRRNSSSTKWSKYLGQDILPLWVADMDFKSPPEVIQALHERVDHGILGYTEVPDSLRELIINHLASYYGWEIKSGWLAWIAAVVPGINISARATGGPGDAIILPVPAYHPFLDVAAHAARTQVSVRLVKNGQQWVMDLDALDAALLQSKANLILLCNPQNPTGRVYSKAELTALAEVALRRDAIICSDEIHCDLLLQPELRHTPVASLGPEIAERTITLMAPTKTFNMPGLNFAFAVIPNAKLRARYRAARIGMQPSLSPLSIVAAEAAYQHGQAWLERLKVYLRGNAQILQETMAELPGVQTTPVEATCLAWLDVREYGLTDPGKHFEEHGLGLSDGKQFDGEGFVRLNFGCPRETLYKALDRFQEAVHAI